MPSAISIIKFIVISCLLPPCLSQAVTADTISFDISNQDINYSELAAGIESEYINPTINNNLNVRGYIYQGYTKSEGNNYYGNSSSSLGSFDDSDIGIMGSYSLNNNVDFRAFLKVRNNGSVNVIRPYFNYSLVDIHNHFDNYRYGIRVGKVRNSVGFYSYTMEDPISRDMDTLPHSIYRPILEDIVNRGDGIQVYLKISNFSTYNLSIEYANTSLSSKRKKDINYAWFAIPSNGVLENIKPATSLSLFITSKDLKWHIKYNVHNVYFKYTNLDNIPIIPSGDYSTEVKLLGVRYYFDDFDITYEYLTSTPISKDWDYIRPSANSVALARNLILRYTQNEKLSYTLGYNIWHTDSIDKSGALSNLKYGVLATNSYYKDLGISVKYKYNNNFIFRAGYHKIRGSSGIAPIENENLLFKAFPTDNLYRLSVTYIF